MSKRKRIITTILIIMTMIVVCIIGIFKFTEAGNYARYFLSVYDSKVSDFDKYKSDYELIVEKIIKLGAEGVITDENNYVIIEESKIYNTYNYDEIILTKDEIKSLKNIEKSFSDDFYPMNMIEVYGDNFISFSTSGYPFGVVYSKNGDKPAGIGEDNPMNYKYKVKKLALNWYTVEGR